MKSIGSELKELVGFGTSSSHDNQPSAGFEELAMPLFRFSLQLRAVDCARFGRCRGSCTRDLSKGFARFRVVSARHQFPGMDISHPEEHLSKLAQDIRAAHDRHPGVGGRRA